MKENAIDLYASTRKTTEDVGRAAKGGHHLIAAHVIDLDVSEPVSLFM